MCFADSLDVLQEESNIIHFPKDKMKLNQLSLWKSPEYANWYTNVGKDAMSVHMNGTVSPSLHRYREHGIIHITVSISTWHWYFNEKQDTLVKNYAKFDGSFKVLIRYN